MRSRVSFLVHFHSTEEQASKPRQRCEWTAGKLFLAMRQRSQVAQAASYGINIESKDGKQHLKAFEHHEQSLFCHL